MKHTLRSILMQIILIAGLSSLAFPARSAPPAKGTSRPAPPPTSTCLEIRPGKGIGIVQLGMRYQALKALQVKHKLSFKREELLSPVYRLGPYRVGLYGSKADPRVTFIDMNFTSDKDCFRVGNKTLYPQGSWYSLAAQLGTCEPMEMRTGGNVIQCANKGVMLLTSRAKGYRVFIEAAKPASPTQPSCAAYLLKGGQIATATKSIRATKSKPASIKLKAGKTYCYRNLVVTTQTKPKQIPGMGQCETYPQIGATVVFCNHEGLAFVFAGPTLILDHIDVYHGSLLPLPTRYPPR